MRFRVPLYLMRHGVQNPGTVLRWIPARRQADVSA